MIYIHDKTPLVLTTVMTLVNSFVVKLWSRSLLARLLQYIMFIV